MLNKKAAQNIKELVDLNNHTLAYIFGCMLIGADSVAEGFEEVKKEIDRIGYLHPYQDTKRRELYDEMLVIARRKLNPDDYNEFYQLF